MAFCSFQDRYRLLPALLPVLFLHHSLALFSIVFSILSLPDLLKCFWCPKQTILLSLLFPSLGECCWLSIELCLAFPLPPLHPHTPHPQCIGLTCICYWRCTSVYFSWLHHSSTSSLSPDIKCFSFIPYSPDSKFRMETVYIYTGENLAAYIHIMSLPPGCWVHGLKPSFATFQGHKQGAQSSGATTTWTDARMGCWYQRWRPYLHLVPHR